MVIIYYLFLITKAPKNFKDCLKRKPYKGNLKMYCQCFEIKLTFIFYFYYKTYYENIKNFPQLYIFYKINFF